MTSASSAPAPENSIVDDRFDHLNVAFVEMGHVRRDVPQRWLHSEQDVVHSADLAASMVEATRLGVDLNQHRVHWREMRDRIFDRIDPMAARGRGHRQRSDNVTVFDAGCFDWHHRGTG